MSDYEWSPDLRALVALMETLSESCWCAGWEHSTEYALWGIVAGDRSPEWGQDIVTEDQRNDLITFATRAGAWVAWQRGGKFDPFDHYAWYRIVPLDEWRSEYADWLNAHDEGYR